MKVLTTPRSYGKTDPEVFAMLRAAGLEVVNDRIVEALPAGSLVINATGLGKDRPGSPLTDHCKFPENGLVWELNYRGTLEFMHQAEAQRERRGLLIEDGWTYFIHGWTQVIAEVFHIDITGERLAACDRLAREMRK